MQDIIHIVVVPYLVWTALFILVWGIDKLWERRKLKHTKDGTPTTGVHSKEEESHE